MNVILLKDVEKLGLKGDVVNVARGYARNYLLPRKLAEVATGGRVAEVKRIEDAAGRARGAERRPGDEIAETLGKTVLRFDVKAGPTGSLFGSVTTTEIADEIWRTRKIRVDRRKIGIDHIKRIGRYTVPIDVFEGVTAELTLLVVPEGGELPPEEELAAMEAAEAAAAAEAAGAAERLRQRPRRPSRRTRPSRSPRPRPQADAETAPVDEPLEDEAVIESAAALAEDREARCGERLQPLSRGPLQPAWRGPGPRPGSSALFSPRCCPRRRFPQVPLKSALSRCVRHRLRTCVPRGEMPCARDT